MYLAASTEMSPVPLTLYVLRQCGRLLGDLGIVDGIAGSGAASILAVVTMAMILGHQDLAGPG